MWLKRSQGSEVKMRQLKSSGSLPAGLALLLAGPEARRGLLKVKGEDAGEVGRRAKELHHWRKKERRGGGESAIALFGLRSTKRAI